jgi:hypothetical protein
VRSYAASHILLRAKTLKFKYIFKYYKKKIQMEDIIIILEWIKRLAKDLRNESMRKEIEE